MKRYFIYTLINLMTMPTYRAHFFMTLLGNILTIVLIFFLWKSIYSSATVLHSMTFRQVFIYLSIASSLYWVNQCWVEWDMSRAVISGNLVNRLIKPVDLQMQILFETFGFVLANIITILLPTILVLFLLRLDIPVGINLVFFTISILFAYLISFHFDYIVGLISLYTESIWGISITKETIILVFSGAIVPFQFFPASIRSVLELLPFQAIYNIPLVFFLSRNPLPGFYIRGILVQLFWSVVLIIISRLVYKVTIRKVTINGG